MAKQYIMTNILDRVHNSENDSELAHELPTDFSHAVFFTSVIQSHFRPNFWWCLLIAFLLGASTMQ